MTMSGGDNHATMRLLAVLVMTPEDQLAEFKRRCLDSRSQVRASQLGAARELLLDVSAALTDGDADDWQRVEQARDVLRRARVKPMQAGTATPQSAIPRAVAPQPISQPVSPPVFKPVPPPIAAPAAPPPLMQQPAPEETVGISQVSPLAGLELPFSGSKTAPEPVRKEDGTAAEAGETAVLGATSPVAHLALPFGEDESSGQLAIELTLEQYASLCASCEVDPGSPSEVERQYGIHSRQQREAVDARWRAQLDANSEQRASFEQLVSQYRSWVRKQGH